MMIFAEPRTVYVAGFTCPSHPTAKPIQTNTFKEATELLKTQLQALDWSPALEWCIATLDWAPSADYLYNMSSGPIRFWVREEKQP